MKKIAFMGTMMVACATFVSRCWAGETATLLSNRAAYNADIATAVQQGKWVANFYKAKTWAVANGVPFVAVWSNGDVCAHSVKFENAVNTTTFKDYMRTSGVVFYFVYSGDKGNGTTTKSGRAADDGCVDGQIFDWVRGNEMTSYPFVRVYWPAGNVDVVATGDMLDGAISGTTGANKCIKWLKAKLKRYEPLSIADGKLVGGGAYCPVVDIPSSVEIVGTNVFFGSSILTRVTIPESVTNIESEAFAQCPNLKTVRFKGNKPDIAETAFAGLPEDCDVCIYPSAGGWSTNFYGRPIRRLSTVTVHYDPGEGDLDADCRETTVVEGEWVGWPTVEPARPGFLFCGWFVGTEDESEMFFGEYISEDTTVYAQWVRSVTVAFDPLGGETDCSEPVTIESGDTVPDVPSAWREGHTFIGWFTAPTGGTRLTGQLTIEDDMTFYAHWANTGHVWYFDLDDSGNAAITGVELADDGMVEIPASLGPYPVTAIDSVGDVACSGFSIPSSVTNICEGAFVDCSGLTSVSIPQVVCSSCLSYVFPSSYQMITNVVISDGVTSIGSGAFSGCGGLTSVIIPDSVTNIGSSAFSDCGSITNVVIGNRVTVIGDCAFGACRSLRKVTIPDSVTTLCVSAVAGGPFFNCSNLSIMFNGNAPDVDYELGHGAFVGDGCVDVYVRYGSTGWGVDIPGMWNGCSIRYFYIVSFDANGGDTGEAVRSVYTGETLGELPIPNREGHMFIGWFTAKEGGEQVTADTVVEGDVSIYARWTPDGTAPGLAAWLAERNLTADAWAANGRTAAECYALGLDPAEATNDFRIVSIEFMDGKPKVEWEPKTNRWTGVEIQTVLKGAERLEGPWAEVPMEGNSAFRFFKVVVELP